MVSKKGRLLVVDGQIFQSIARHRGMGRYSEYLLNAIISKQSYETVIIILSKNSHITDDDSSELDKLFSGTDIVYLDLQSATSHQVEDAEEHNTHLLNEYVSSLNVSSDLLDFLILGPFQEPVVSVFPDDCNKYLVFYDLIPYLYHEQYKNEMPFENYLRHFNLLFSADKLLTISQAVKDDLTMYLGIPYEKSAAIHGAAVHSRKDQVAPDIKIPTKFILMPTGDDPRKNNMRAVLGFEEFNSANNNEYTLVITSTMNQSERARLSRVSKRLIFTGNVDEAVLDWLYHRASTVLFVPEIEGLGLPLLEAVESNRKVVCSSIDAFYEISKSAFYYCDHTDPHSVSLALKRALTGSLKDIPSAEYARILHYYSWDQTAERAVNMMKLKPTIHKNSKKKIAVFIPAPDGISAIGKVIAETHSSLIDHFDVDYYYESGPANVSTRPNYLRYISNYYPATQFSVESYKKYSAVFYHIGNSEYHIESIANSLYLPGYVILHDTNISDAYRVMADRDVISTSRAALETEINNVARLKLSKNLVSVVNNQQGVLVHSEYALDAVNEASNRGVLVKKVNLPTAVPAFPPIRTYKRLTLGLAGIIADIKGTEIIETLAKDDRYKNHHFSIFGYNYSTAGTISRLKSYGNVEISTNITDLDFVVKMRHLDIFVNYRMQYQGETSLSTLEAMRQGVVVIVRNIGWYGELPDDAVIKVNDIDQIVEVLNELMIDPVRLKKISERAIRYVQDVHTHTAYVSAMLDILNTIKSGDSRIKNTVRLLQSGSIKLKSDLAKVREK